MQATSGGNERCRGGGLLEPRPPPGAIFPRLKPGRGEAQATGTMSPHKTHSTNHSKNHINNNNV